MSDFCGGLVFLPVPVHPYRAIFIRIFPDHSMLSVIGAYSEKGSNQKKVPGDRYHRAAYSAHDGNFVGNYHIGW